MNTNNEFLTQLKVDMDELEALYDISSLMAKFSAWVGWKIFDQRVAEVIDDAIFYVGDSGAIAGYFDVGLDRTLIIMSYFTINASNPINPITLHEKWKEIKGAHKNATFPEKEFLLELEDRGVMDYELYYVTNGVFTEKTSESMFSSKIRLLNLNRLKEVYLRTQHPLRVKEPDTIILNLQEGCFFWNISSQEAQEDVPTLVCKLMLGDVHKWVKQHRNGLFAENLRYRLSSSLEDEIIDTIKTKPKRMFVKNNGVTIICKKIVPELDSDEWKGKHGPSKVVLHYPQVVNGCQTSWVVHDTIEDSLENSSSLPTGSLLAKIVQTGGENENLAMEIATSSNKQNAILPRDQKAKDNWQRTISKKLAEHAPNLGIFWNYRRGGEDVIKDTGNELIYKIKNQPKMREIDNSLAGQIILAMAGYVDKAKHERNKIFTSETLYNTAFGYELGANERFFDFGERPLMRTGGQNATDEYVEDLLFGFAVHQHAESVFKWLYSDRQADLISQSKSRSFVKFWRFDVIRFIHVIVEEWVSVGRDRKLVRKDLVGNLMQSRYLNPLFMTKAKRPKWFKMEEDISLSNTLDILSPAIEKSIMIGAWFSSLEDLGARVIENLSHADKDATHRQLILNRPTTHKKILREIRSKFNTSDFVKQFPLRD